MTSLQHVPHLLSFEEFEALPENKSARYEVQEGVLIVTPRPVPKHAHAAFRLARQLDDQLPSGLAVLQEVDVPLNRIFPPTVRIPDLVITRSADLDAMVRVEDVLVAIEIISPGSRRTDTLIKPVEYAEAGIPHYWLIDLDAPATLTAYHRAGDLGYQESPAVSGEFRTTAPVPVRLDLSGLTTPR
ncbi:MAG TPA: Uma2 family endonuclease [Mycobacteriales bacterium]|nr:Uma2 family endonuclease [Mycobacteriales bacterium]